MQAYGDAKERLFAFADLQHIVINIGDTSPRVGAQVGGVCPSLRCGWTPAPPAWLADRSLHAATWRST